MWTFDVQCLRWEPFFKGLKLRTTKRESKMSEKSHQGMS